MNSASSAAGAVCSERMPPLFPDGPTGLLALPGSQGRQVWWTGRVAIGLRYERPPPAGPMPHSATWIQELLLTGGGALPS